MKKYLFISMFALQALSTLAQERNGKEPFMTRSLSDAVIKNVKAQSSGGNIAVTGVASNARIEVYVNKNNNGSDLSKDEIQKRINEDYDFNISVENNNITAVAKPKRQNMDWKKSLNISFRFFVPRNVATELATSGGNIELQNIAGKQDFSTSGGNLELDHVGGNIQGRTSGGNIHLSECNDEIDLQTSGGNIQANNCAGNIRLETSGGSLRLANLKGKIKANTSGGNVKGESIFGELISNTSGGNIDLQHLSCSLETSTSGGNIDVSVKEFGKYITIHNSGGNIELQIPRDKGVDLKLSADKIKTRSLNNFNGKTGDDYIDGTLNGGGIPVNVMASSGKITLSFN